MRSVGLIVYSAPDVAAAKQFFTTYLGVEPYADSPYYVGYRAGEAEIGLAPSAQHAGGLAYVTVDDIGASLAGLVAAGGKTVQDVTDVAQGLLTAIVEAPGGALVGLRQFPKT